MAGALAVHAGLFLFTISSASGSLVSAAAEGGGPSGPVFEISLVRLPSQRATDGADAGGIDALKARQHAGGIGDPLAVQDHAPDGAFAALERQLRAVQPKSLESLRVADQQRPDSGLRRTSPAPFANTPGPAHGHDQAGAGEATGEASTGALWGAIEPCWRNLGVRGRVAVVLEVALDSTGGLRTPPKVIRSSAAPIDEPRLQAEAGALAAIAACAPRGNAMLGGRTYRLEFPAVP